VNTYRHIWLCTLYAVLCIVLLGSCRPRGVLSSGKMRAVLVDLHKTDAMIQTAGFVHSDREIKMIYYAQVMEKHGITTAQFDSSLVWYTAHPQLFNKIYPKVLADLKAEEDRYNALIAERTGEETIFGYEHGIHSFEMHTLLDTTIWEWSHGLYPIPRMPYTATLDSLMHDSIDQLFPQISVLR